MEKSTETLTVTTLQPLKDVRWPGLKKNLLLFPLVLIPSHIGNEG
jgi:hypothetical protein